MTEHTMTELVESYARQLADLWHVRDEPLAGLRSAPLPMAWWRQTTDVWRIIDDIDSRIGMDFARYVQDSAHHLAVRNEFT